MGYKKYSKEQELQIVEEYRQGVSSEILREKYGFKTKKSITDKVKKYFPDEWEDIKQQNKNTRKGYCYKMEKLSNEFDAYFLGLLLTDGYVVSNRNQVGIDLADEDCIEFLSKTIGKEYKTYTSNNRCHELNNRIIEDKKDRHRVMLSDKELIKNLQRFGVIEHKTDIIPTPKLLPEEEKYIPYIIRGIIDGDGNIDARKNTLGFRICTKSAEFAKWIQDVLTNKMFMQDICVHQGKNNLYTVETYQILNIFKLLALSYNKPFGMQRKYNKIRETFRDYNNSFFLE